MPPVSPLARIFTWSRSGQRRRSARRRGGGASGARRGRWTPWSPGPLGAQFLVWEYATALAGRIIGINPFDQPNVQESKDNTAALLARAGDGPLPVGKPAFVDGVVEVHADPERLRGATDLAGVLDFAHLVAAGRGYLAIMAYLDRMGDSDAARLRAALAVRTTHPVTFGWGPRFLHSTGQFHKGGPQTGVFLQITGAIERDVQVPDAPYSLGRLQLAQALGDLGALRGRGRPAVRLHLRNRAAGLAQLLARRLPARRQPAGCRTSNRRDDGPLRRQRPTARVGGQMTDGWTQGAPRQEAWNERTGGRPRQPTAGPERPADPPRRRAVRAGDLRGHR